MKTAHDLVLQAKAHVREIALQDAEEAIRQADVLIDVREADEFAAGHLPGAVLVPRGLLEFKLSGTPALSGRDLKVVLYCKTSGRAALAAAGKTVVKPEQPAFE
jgi:rhodanese-related sulfurtransferase